MILFFWFFGLLKNAVIGRIVEVLEDWEYTNWTSKTTKFDLNWKVHCKSAQPAQFWVTNAGKIELDTQNWRYNGIFLKNTCFAQNYSPESEDLRKTFLGLGDNFVQTYKPTISVSPWKMSWEKGPWKCLSPWRSRTGVLIWVQDRYGPWLRSRRPCVASTSATH